MPRLMVHNNPLLLVVVGMTEAMVTWAPNRVKVSVMHVVSISSDPSAMGTKTRFVMLRAEVDVDDDDLVIVE